MSGTQNPLMGLSAALNQLMPYQQPSTQPAQAAQPQSQMVQPQQAGGQQQMTPQQYLQRQQDNAAIMQYLQALKPNNQPAAGTGGYDPGNSGTSGYSPQWMALVNLQSSVSPDTWKRIAPALTVDGSKLPDWMIGK